jgi:hypothetical protein
MSTKALRLFLLFPLAVACLPKLAYACDEPGTPNKEQLRADGHGRLIYSFDNTARVGSQALSYSYASI